MTKPDESDETGWIAAAKTGDQGASHSLVSHYAEALLRAGLALCHDRQMAEDIAQETFIEAWRYIERFDRGRSQFSTWLYGILRNRFLKALRFRQRHQAEPFIEPKSQLESIRTLNPACSVETKDSAQQIW